MLMAMDVHDRQWFVMLIVSESMAVFAVQTRHGRDYGVCFPGSRAVLCVYNPVSVIVYPWKGRVLGHT
jgi:hypothetical protein